MRYDTLIVGSGLVGATLACALPPASIAIIDQFDLTPRIDHRLLALTEGSCQLFKNLGLWADLAEHATPIKQLHVSKKGQFGITRVHAEELGVATLGYLVPAQAINFALEKKLKTLPHVQVIRPATLKNLTFNTDQITIEIDHEQKIKNLTSQFVIGADGTDSTVRTLLNIPTKKMDYHQTALVTITQLQRPHHYVAYERFLKSGAIALLPMQNDQVATIWTDDTHYIDELLKLSDTDFLAILQKQFGYRLGKFVSIGKRMQYPLKLISAEETKRGGVTLIGNAAHTMHPLAAQGLNLALYEIAQYVEGANNPQRFNFPREKLSHYLLNLFTNDFLPIALLRQLSMLSLDILASAKSALINHAMGRSGRTPKGLLENPYEREFYDADKID